MAPRWWICSEKYSRTHFGFIAFSAQKNSGRRIHSNRIPSIPAELEFFPAIPETRRETPRKSFRCLAGSDPGGFRRQTERSSMNPLCHCAAAQTCRTDPHRLRGSVCRRHVDPTQVRAEFSPRDPLCFHTDTTEVLRTSLACHRVSGRRSLAAYFTGKTHRTRLLRIPVSTPLARPHHVTRQLHTPTEKPIVSGFEKISSPGRPFLADFSVNPPRFLGRIPRFVGSNGREVYRKADVWGVYTRYHGTRSLHFRK